MNNENSFYSPDEIRPLYSEIVPAYQRAFAGEPWFEVSQCVDERRRCPGGLSCTEIGSVCSTCGLTPIEPAYEAQGLIERFEGLATTRPTTWYTERVQGKVALAGVAWEANPRLVAAEKYEDVAEMAEWLERAIGPERLVWLDEVFADAARRVSGNLRNFGAMCRGFMERLGATTLAYRTINPRMTFVAARDFGERAVILERKVGVPDRRDFVVIDEREAGFL